MNQIEGIIRTVSPVHLGTGRSQGTFLPTLDYLPGRTIRGMLGYYLFHKDINLFSATGIGEYKDTSKIKIHFRNAYPVSETGETVCSPLSLKWCKRCNSLMEEDDFFCRKKNEGKSCLHEGKKRAGFISDTSFSSKVFRAPGEVKKTITTKCPIIRGTHTSPGSEEDGYNLSPYHVQAIAEGQKFRFKILVDDRFVDPIRIKDALAEASLYAGIGGFRSRGYGLVQFEEVRVRDLIEIVKQRRIELEKLKGSPATLVTNAPMILRNNGKSVIGFDDHPDQTFLKEANACLKSAQAKTELRLNPTGKTSLGRDIARGWSLEKANPVDEIIPCIGPGSTIPIVVDDPGAITALEIFGIGDMTYCGYGQVYCLPDVESRQKEVS